MRGCKGQTDDETDLFVGAFRSDGAVVQLYDLLGNGKSQSGAACAAGTGLIQAEELLEQATEFFRRDGAAMVFKRQYHFIGKNFGADGYRSTRIAVMAGIAQKIIKDPGHFVGVAGIFYPWGEARSGR